MKNGVLVVDKERGPTSHDVVARARKQLATREVGHAGTLDPMATGVLVLAIGQATKLVPWLTADDKSYEATIRFGIATDTLDAEGAETQRLPVPDDLATRLPAAIDAERARTSQIPPVYSAIKVDGQRSHDLARKGKAPDLAPREVAVRSLDVLEVRPDEIRVTLAVAKGYFVRSLARDLAAALGTVGHLTALRRTRSGAFTLADATGAVLSLDDAAKRALPVSTLTEAGVVAVSFGRRVLAADLTPAHDRPSAWVDAEGRLVAVGEILPDGTGRVLRGGFTPRRE